MQWFITNWNDFIMGIITGLLTTGLIALASTLYQDFVNRKSQFSGKWEQLIYKSGDDTYSGPIIKRDIYELKHIKLKRTGKIAVNVTGTIQRQMPDNQRHRKWDFIGYLDGNILTILYESAEAQVSRGCIYLILSRDKDGRDRFRGFYLEEHQHGVIDKTPLVIQKLNN